MTTNPSARIFSFILQLWQFVLPFTVLLVFLALGNALQSFLGTWIPGSVIGMLLLLIVLSSNIVPAAFLDRLSDWLLDRLGLFFVCPGVEIVRYLDLIGAHWSSLALAIVGSSLVTLVATGWMGEVRLTRQEHRDHHGESKRV